MGQSDAKGKGIVLEDYTNRGPHPCDGPTRIVIEEKIHLPESDQAFLKVPNPKSPKESSSLKRMKPTHFLKMV